jgi:hypothetical protein
VATYPTAKIDDVLAHARREQPGAQVLDDRPWLVYGCGSTGRAWNGFDTVLYALPDE